jgi:antitoxin MazE
VTRKVFRAGNSTVVALPREVMAEAGVAEGHEVTVEYDAERGGILVKPVRREVFGIDEEFVRQVNGFIGRYRPMLDALAKHEPPVS